MMHIANQVMKEKTSNHVELKQAEAMVARGPETLIINENV